MIYHRALHTSSRSICHARLLRDTKDGKLNPISHSPEPPSIYLKQTKGPRKTPYLCCDNHSTNLDDIASFLPSFCHTDIATEISGAISHNTSGTGLTAGTPTVNEASNLSNWEVEIICVSSPTAPARISTYHISLLWETGGSSKCSLGLVFEWISTPGKNTPKVTGVISATGYIDPSPWRKRVHNTSDMNGFSRKRQ